MKPATLNESGSLARPEVGVIAPGAWGDLVAVRGDPTRDVRLLEHVDAVIKGGQLVKGPGVTP